MSKVQLLTNVTESLLPNITKHLGAEGTVAYEGLRGFFDLKNKACKDLLKELKTCPGTQIKTVGENGVTTLKGTHPEYGDFKITTTKTGGDVLIGTKKTEKTVTLNDTDVFTLTKRKKSLPNDKIEKEKLIHIGEGEGTEFLAKTKDTGSGVASISYNAVQEQVHKYGGKVL